MSWDHDGTPTPARIIKWTANCVKKVLTLPLGSEAHLSNIQLAPRENVCLIAGTIVQLGRIPSSARHMPTSALGAFLALLLLVATTFSVNHALHQSLHQDGAASGHFCLVCSFAKGQVSAAVVAIISAVLVFSCLWGVCQRGTSPFPGFDYRTSPSRAPPRL